MAKKKIGNSYRPEEEKALEDAVCRVRGLKEGQTPKQALAEYFWEKAEKLLLAGQLKEVSQVEVKKLKDIPDKVVSAPAKEPII